MDRCDIGSEEHRRLVNRQHNARRNAQQTPLFLAQALRLHKCSFGFYPDLDSASHVDWRKWIFLVMVDNLG
jgi:hypothetical protein